MDIDTAELAAMAKENPSMVHQVVAPAGSTLIFGETTVHATGPLRSGRNPHGHCWDLGCILPRVPAMIVRTGERIVLSTGYGASNVPYWHGDGTSGYRPMSEQFLASVPSELTTLFKGRQNCECMRKMPCLSRG